MLELEFSKNSSKFLKKCEKEITKRILEKIEKLCTNPFLQDCKRVEGRAEKVFRIRIGDYRVLYIILKEENKLLVSSIDKRERAYD